jgi:hypothetical protein
MRPVYLIAALAALAACNRSNGAAAADSAAVPNTSLDSSAKTGPVGDSLSSAAAGATVAPNAATPPGPDSARPGAAGKRP